MFVKMKLFSLILFLALVYSCTVLAETAQICNLPEEEYFRAGLIEVVDFDCDANRDCGLVIEFPVTFKDTQFVDLSLSQGDKDNLELLVPLKTFEEGKILSSHLYGKEDFIENLSFRLIYERINGCAYWSTYKIKHHKKRNEIDGPEVPPSR